MVSNCYASAELESPGSERARGAAAVGTLNSTIWVPSRLLRTPTTSACSQLWLDAYCPLSGMLPAASSSRSRAASMGVPAIGGFHFQK